MPHVLPNLSPVRYAVCSVVVFELLNKSHQSEERSQPETSLHRFPAQMLPDQLSSSSTLCFAHYDKWLQTQCGQLLTIFWWWTLNINISTSQNWYIYKEIVNKIKQTLKAFPCPIEQTSSNLESVLFSYWTFLSTSNSFFRKVSSSLVSPWYNPSTTLPWQRDLHSFFKQGLTKHCHHHPSVPG